MSKKPTVLMILDGYGLNDTTKGNAVAEGKTPVMDKLMAEYPFVKGNASGMAVGLPEGQMGNSEVGHLNMGAGRIIYQELTKITKAIEDGDFFENQALLAACKNAKENNTALHMMGLVSDGGVHSHNGHIYGLLELAKRQGVEKVYVHCFLDGRDTPPASGKEYVEALEAKMKEIGIGEVASVSGRYYAMDRDNRWDRVERAYNALVKGEGVQAESATAGIQASYDADKTDEFVEPMVIVKDGAPVATPAAARARCAAGSGFRRPRPPARAAPRWVSRRATRCGRCPRSSRTGRRSCAPACPARRTATPPRSRGRPSRPARR